MENENKILSEWLPDTVLLNRDTVSKISSSYANSHEVDKTKSKYMEILVSLVIELILGAIAIIPTWNTMNLFAQIAIGILSGAIIIYMIICGTLMYLARKQIKGVEIQELDSMLLDQIKNDIKYTGICRITYVDDKGQILYLIDNDYFLPHCALDRNISITEQISYIKKALQNDFGIKEKYIRNIEAIDNKIHFRIKPIRGNLQMNGYAFYDVKIKIQYKNKLIASDNVRTKWASIEKMKSNATAMATNKDVIDLLSEFPAPIESFATVLGMDYKIIWNITSKCPYKCDICATYDPNRKEISLQDKLKVLHSISTAKEKIKSLDFAGGDPLSSSDSISIIKSAIESLGEEKVSVTTTGKSLEKLTRDDFSKIIRRCEITLDASHDELKAPTDATQCSLISRNENEYSKNNITSASSISSYADELIINIPIIDDDLTDNEIDSLIEKIKKIKQLSGNISTSVSIIRLMPVGKLATKVTKEQYLKYHPIETVKKIILKLNESDIPYKLHCSLRILPAFGSSIRENHCSMFENKLGIDCQGNVFACAWGGYLNSSKPITQNPFYLGNLTKTPLSQILSGESSTNVGKSIINQIDTKQYYNFCCVVSAYYDKNYEYQNFDPLSK